MTDAERATATALAIWEHRALNMPRHPPDGHLRPETVRLEHAVTQLARERGTTTLVVRESIVTNEVVADVDRSWQRFTVSDGPVPRPSDWYITVEKFWALGLCDVDIYIRHIDRALCGCCWRSLAEMQEQARALIAEGAA